jgi:cell shape-determining protein MreC
MAKTFNTLGKRRNNSWFSFRIFIYVFLCVFIGGVVVVWRAPLENALWSVAAPFERMRASFGASDVTRLRAELASTTARLADRDALYQENLELKRRLSRDAGVQVILAAVLQRPPQIPYDTFVVDAGTAEGVAVGDTVSAGGTTLIGSVRAAFDHTSRVVLFSAPGETYDVILHSGEQAVPVQMQGQGSGSFRGQVPAGTPVSVGDVLTFPGIASGFVGTVSHVTAHEGESFETLYARLPVDSLNLQFVEIHKTYVQQ